MGGLVFADCEANGLTPTKIHCISVYMPSIRFQFTFTDMDQFVRWVESINPSAWVFHNGLGYDVKWINKLVKEGIIDPKKVIDTFVVSRLINYSKFKTHSLKEIGEFLGVFKGDYTGGWETCSEEMISYCEQDVVVTESIYTYYSKFIKDNAWKKSLRVEHDMAWICTQMSDNGFYFAKEAAEKLLNTIETECNELRDSFDKSFPPKLEEIKRIQYRTKSDGTLYKNVQEAFDSFPLCKVEGSELICMDYVPFNPNSKEDRIDVLWEAGWKPTDKTDGYKKLLKESFKNDYKR